MRRLFRFIAFGPLAATLLSLTTADRLSAQSNAVLMLLDVGERRLEVGGEFTGALSSSDYLNTDNSYLEPWALEGTAGQTVYIDLIADDFDPYLYLAGPGLDEILFDDDSGGGCNARIVHTFLESGTFRVVASSLTRQTGTYTIRVSTTPQPDLNYACGGVDPNELAALPTDGRSVSIGAPQSGTLSSGSPVVDGRPAEAWTFDGRAGQAISVRLESSAFDGYLYLAGPGLVNVLQDDDGAGGLNPLIATTLPSDGQYTIVASTISPDASGSYAITIEQLLSLSDLTTDGRTLQLGTPVTGRLDAQTPITAEGRRGQAWAFDAESGQAVTFELRSNAFDAYLYLLGPGFQQPLEDDDGGENFNSRLSVTFPSAGTYTIVVSSIATNAEGMFTLEAR